MNKSKRKSQNFWAMLVIEAPENKKRWRSENILVSLRFSAHKTDCTDQISNVVVMANEKIFKKVRKNYNLTVEDQDFSKIQIFEKIGDDWMELDF